MRRLEIRDEEIRDEGPIPNPPISQSPNLLISQFPNLCPKNDAPVEKERGRCLKNQADGL